MEVQDRRDSPPLWLQLPVSATKLRRRPQASPIFTNSITLVIIIPLLILLVLSFILSFVSQTSQIFRNNIVKNGWDLLNVSLVLFAILCGVIGKLHDDEMQAIAIHTSTVSDQIKKDKHMTSSTAIFDEFDFMTNNPPTSQIVQSGVNEVKCDDCNIKVIPVDTCVLCPARLSTKSPPLPSNPEKSRRRRLPKSILHAEKQDRFVNIRSAVTLHRHPPLVSTAHQPNIVKKSGAGKNIATAMASLYKRTKKRIHSEASASPPHSSSLFSNMLKPGVKFNSKKVQSNCFNDGKKTVDVGSNQQPEFSPVPPRILRKAEVAFEDPEVENVELWPTMGSQDAWDGNQLAGSVVFPSPDVNIKADNFIARLRGEWKLDKFNS